MRNRKHDLVGAGRKVGRDDCLTQRDAPVGPPRITQIGDGCRCAVAHIARRIDNHDAGRGCGDIRRKLGSVAVVSAAKITGSRCRDAVARVNPDAIQRQVETRIAGPVGRDGRESQIPFAFAVGTIRNSWPTGEEFDPIAETGIRVKRPDERRAGRIRIR